MKIVIDREKCVGHARCASVASNLFPLDADGYIASDGFEVPKGQEESARKGARACPERVITVKED